MRNTQAHTTHVRGKLTCNGSRKSNRHARARDPTPDALAAKPTKLGIKTLGAHNDPPVPTGFSKIPA